MCKLIQYRNKCIGCGTCFEMQPELWRMSRKDGKATLIMAQQKKQVFVLPIGSHLLQQATAVAAACPVKIIKLQ